MTNKIHRFAKAKCLPYIANLQIRDQPSAGRLKMNYYSIGKGSRTVIFVGRLSLSQRVLRSSTENYDLCKGKPKTESN